ncbi:MAG: NAD(P)H-hydrate dehydratase [Bacillota bacterium]
MIVLTPEEMRKMDRISIEDAYPEVLLMEMAGRGVADKAAKVLKNNSSQITILCGKGNNGGDGFTAARYLDMWGFNVKVLFTSIKDELSEVSSRNYQIAKLRNIQIEKVNNLDENEIINIINNSDLIIDALLGTGIKGKVRGIYAKLIDFINKSKNNKAKVLAIDIPSGVDGLNGEIHAKAVKADLTVTMAFYKTGLLLYPGRKYCGQIDIVDLGMLKSSLEKIDYNNFLVNEKEASNILPKRKEDGHKGSFGKVLVVGGSKTMSGAPSLSARAVLKSGAGLIKLAVPKSLSTINFQDEIITEYLSENDGFLDLNSYKKIEELSKKADVIAYGPGLGQSKDLILVTKKIVKNINKTLVLDADGINCLAKLDDLNMLKNRRAPLVLTPHLGEMARLLNKSISDIKKNKVKISREFALKYEVNLILKGATTLIALENGELYFNTTGNSGLATAGSGDVLTGIIASLIAQGLTPKKAAVLAPYLHGKSAEIAKEYLSEYSIVAEDIINYLANVIIKLANKR